MYTRRRAAAALVSFNSIRPHLKVCRISVNALASFRNFATAFAQRSDLYNNFDENITQNQSPHVNSNQSNGLYGLNSAGVEQTQNPSRVYSQPPSGNFAAQNTDSYNASDGIRGNHLSRVEHNQYSSGGFHGQNVNLNGYNGSFTGQSIQNQVGILPKNQGGYFDGNAERVQSSFGDCYATTVKGEIARPCVPDAVMHQSNGSGFRYSNEGNRMRSWGTFRGGGFSNSQVSNVVDSNVGSVEVVEESQSIGTIENLDELIKGGQLHEAVELLQLLEQNGLIVDLPRYLALMEACGENEALEQGKVVHVHLLKSLSDIDLRTHNKILEMYLKCGAMDDAFAVFNKMPTRNLTSWDIMISMLAKIGLGEVSIELFEEFKKTGLKPDGQMFLGVFSACGVLGDTIEGMLHFESMMKDYGIAPSMEHYVGVVAMFGTAGYLDEAVEFIENMPVEPNVKIWETLMKFCRIQGNSELGDRCAELVELLDCSRLNDQSRAGLIPINASDLEREKVKRKLSGRNLLDVRSKVHEYRAGDRSHPDNERIYTLLRGLRQQMKDAGYVAETKFVLHDVDQESKEEALMAHSERLAAAQGFLTSAPRSQMRIIKNLRVCGDCHTAFKIISKIVGRQIIARDSKRFHHFENGSCSCNDYW